MWSNWRGCHLAHSTLWAKTNVFIFGGIPAAVPSKRHHYIATTKLTEANLKFVSPCIIIYIQINQPTRCNTFSSLLLDVYLQLNMFRASSRPSSGAQQPQKQPLVLPLERGDSSAVGRGRPDHDQQHCYHHATKVKPQAASAAVELLMMGVRTPETGWAVNKRQVINWRSCCN
jgi:hypothetical protein